MARTETFRVTLGKSLRFVAAGLYRLVPSWTSIRHTVELFFVSPLLVGLAVALVFVGTDQAQDVFTRIIQAGDVAYGWYALGVVGLFSLQIFYWQNLLGMNVIHRTFTTLQNLEMDQGLKRWNSLIGIFASCLPVCGLIVGFIAAYLHLDYDLGRLAALKQGQAVAPDATQETGLWELIVSLASDLGPYLSLFLLTAVLALIVHAILEAIPRTMPEAAYSAERRRNVILAVYCVLGFGFCICLLVAPATSSITVSGAQMLGPIGTLVFAFIMLVNFGVMISAASALSGIPLLPLITGALLTLFFVGLSYDTPTQRPQEFATESNASAADQKQAQAVDDRKKLRNDFESWLEKRPNKECFTGRPYPVFIVATQGGGAYAQAATLLFLSDLQDRHPSFAHHVFAISAVSGGAVGAATFTSLMSAKWAADLEAKKAADLKPDKTRQPCIQASQTEATGILMAQAQHLALADHLSPALLQTWPDFFRLFGELFEMLLAAIFVDEDVKPASFNRAKAQEASVVDAFNTVVREKGTPEKLDASPQEASELRQPFASHWSPASKTPALILNGTWSETGYRAAFAPFALNAISDGTLFTMPIMRQGPDELIDVPISDFKPAEFHPRPSVIEAAFFSARFPGIVSAYSVEASVPDDTGTEKRLWNFVDGGYADNSGTLTAGELYLALNDLAAATDKDKKSHGGDIGGAKPQPTEPPKRGQSDTPLPSLHLIVLARTNTAPNVQAVGSGTSLNDTVAPIRALMNVTWEQAGRAIRRVQKAVERPKTELWDVADDPSAPSAVSAPRFLLANYYEPDFKLPLGWSVAPRTVKILEYLLGTPSPNACANAQKAKNADTENESFARAAHQANSCLKQRIIDLLQN